MANKRQRKKQIKQKKTRQLQQAGVSTSGLDVTRLSNSEMKKLIDKQKKEQRKAKRRQKERRVYNSLVAEGVDHKQAQKMRSWGQKRIDDYLRDRREKYRKKVQRKQRRKRTPDKGILMVFWRDKVDVTDEYAVNDLRMEAATMSEAELIIKGRALLRAGSGGAIGEGSMVIAKDEQNARGLDAFYGDDQVRVYKGKAKRYDKLVEMIYVLMNLIYDGFEKYDFMARLVQNVSYLSPTNAKRIQKDYQLRLKGF